MREFDSKTRPAAAAFVLATVGCLVNEPGPGDVDLGTTDGVGTDGGPGMTADPPGTGTGGTETGADSAGTGAGPGTQTGATDSETTGGAGGHDGVACGVDLVCELPEICCAAMSGSGCAPGCTGDQVETLCDGPEDCETGVCCWGLTGGSACHPGAGDCGGITPDVACHGSADCPGGAPCEPHPFVSWISLCG